MRVLVATGSWQSQDSPAGLDSAQVGAALARAWARLGDEAAVLPVAPAGQGFADCLNRLTGSRPLSPRWPDAGEDRWTASSAPLGELLRSALESWAPVRPPVLELASAPWRDGGHGMMDALGPMASRLSGMTLVTSVEEADRQLTGLRGLVSTEARSEGMDPARMLRLDQVLCDWAAELTGAPQAGTAPGSGAAGGVGMAVSALGGEVTTGSRFLLEAAAAERSAATADLIVTGVRHLDAMSLTGEVISTVTGLAGRAGVPVIAMAATNEVSERELRASGLEAALALEPGTEPVGRSGAAAITDLAVPVARTWHW